MEVYKVVGWWVSSGFHDFYLFLEQKLEHNRGIFFDGLCLHAFRCFLTGRHPCDHKVMFLMVTNC